MPTETNTITYIDEKRLLNGLSPVERHPMLSKYKSPKQLIKELKPQSEKNIFLFLLNVCENGTLEDLEFLNNVAREYKKTYDFKDPAVYRVIVQTCIEENYISENGTIYEA